MNQLLHTPEGVRDFIGRDCSDRNDLVSRIYDVLTGYGYSMIDTPAFEYIDCYSLDIGSTSQNELYKFFDKNGNILALRPDFTPSVARVASKYFSDSNELIKLYYAGNVYKNHPSYKGRLHESRQVGAEYIGDSTIEADAEMIALSVQSIACANIRDFSISIGHSDIFSGLCEASGLNKDQSEELKHIILNKNFFGMEEYLEKLGIENRFKEAFVSCMKQYNDEASLLKLCDSLSGIKKVQDAILYLKEILSLAKTYNVDNYVSIDLSLINEYKYYTGIIFLGFTYGSGNAVLSGGRYDKLLSHFGKDAPAIGFTILVDDLLEASKRQGMFDFTYEIKDIILYEKLHRVEAIKNAIHMRKMGKKVLLVQYNGKEELENYKTIYNRDNVFLITDGKE